MRKEVIIAAFVGILLGGTIAFGVWRANVYFSQKGGAATSQNSKTEGENGQKKGSLLALTNIEDLDVVTQSPHAISGITQADTLVAISTEADDYLFFSDKKGVFEGKIDLAPGLNKLSVTVLSNEKKIVETELSVVYSSEFTKNDVLAQSSSPPPSAVPTPTGSDSVRERVEARISQAQKKARAEVGTVTDITEGSFQIRTPSGDISQVIYEKDNVTIVKIGKTKSEIKPADVALGDFIVAMGYQSIGKSPLLARRILVTPAPVRLKISISIGSVASVSKKEIALSLPGNTSVKIPPGDKIVIVKDVEGVLKTVKFIDVKEGAKIVAWQTESDGNQKTRKVQILNP